MQKDVDDIPPNLRYIDRKKVAAETQKVNNCLKYITTRNITESNRLVQAAANIVAEEVGFKRNEDQTKKKKEPPWRRRILQTVTKLRTNMHGSF